MAHVTVEWTVNLAGAFDVKELLTMIAEEMRLRADGVFPVGGIRVRAIAVTDYVIADGADADDAFIDIRVLMGAGRPAAFRQRFFDQLFVAVKRQLAELLDRRAVALSMYVAEAEGWKENTIHRRLSAAEPKESV